MVQNPRRYSAVVNNFPENQHNFCRLKAVSGENSYNDLVKDNLIFDSIANFDRNTKLKINNSIQRRQARFRNFPDTTLGELLDYTDPPLVEGNYDTAMVHVSISDIINDDSSAEVEDMVSNCDKVKKIYVTKNVCLLGLVFTN